VFPSNDNRSSIKQTEWTYGLMMHFSNSLGINCTGCHNSRSWNDWSQSPQRRATAWHGIRMVRNLNAHWLNPLQPIYPEYRLGETGDAPKANCMTCHQGAYKPLLGQSMLQDFPSLSRAWPQPVKAESEPKPEPMPTEAPAGEEG
jgi:photosynthetic reaction center cytochrome c subunit